MRAANRSRHHSPAVTPALGRCPPGGTRCIWRIIRCRPPETIAPLPPQATNPHAPLTRHPRVTRAIHAPPAPTIRATPATPTPRRCATLAPADAPQMRHQRTSRDPQKADFRHFRRIGPPCVSSAAPKPRIVSTVSTGTPKRQPKTTPAKTRHNYDLCDFPGVRARHDPAENPPLATCGAACMVAVSPARIEAGRWGGPSSA